MAHEFATERWDAAAVFLITRLVLPQRLDIGITSNAICPLSQLPDRYPLQLACVAFSSTPFLS